MINRSADIVIPTLILYIGIIGYLVVDFFWLRRHHKNRRKTLTRGRIIYLTWGAEAMRLSMLAVLLCTPPTLAFLHGGIGLGGWIGSVCMLMVFMAVLLCIRLWSCWPVLQALHVKKHIPLPTNAELENTDGTWFYQDENWYIRINGVYALLYAPYIDFEVPVQYEFRNSIKPGIITCLRFAERDGTSQLIRHDLDERIEKWVKAHRGCFFKKTEPKKALKKKRR